MEMKLKPLLTDCFYFTLYVISAVSPIWWNFMPNINACIHA